MASRRIYYGVVKNGVVVLEGRAHLPEGTSVMVQPVKSDGPVGKKPRRIPTVYQRLKPFIGIADDLPPDFSINHDHYLYGAPKRK